jgi:hypothetical protein
MLHPFRHWLLILFLLLAQSGALAHGLSHVRDVDGDHQHVCEQCLAYAPMGAGAVGTLPVWSVPTQGISFDAAIPPVSDARFLACYQSRAPPRLNG